MLEGSIISKTEFVLVGIIGKPISFLRKKDSIIYHFFSWQEADVLTSNLNLMSLCRVVI